MAYEDLAYHYSGEEQPFKAAYFAERAMGDNDDLDLSVLIAQQYIELDDPEKAKE